NTGMYPGEKSCVATASRVHNHEVVVTMADDGVGLANSELTRSFEMFMQGEQSVDRHDGGHGSGLPIARSLARLHGGDLRATSEGPDLGATFTLTLPRVESLPAGEQESPAPTPAFTGDGLVLVVDDNVDAAVSLAQLLELWGLRTRMVHDGRAVLPAIEECVPDLVLLDIGLPGMDGYQVAESIRADPRWRSLRLIALTGYGQAGDRERSREVGFDAHLVKPVDFSLLESLLSETMGRKVG